MSSDPLSQSKIKIFSADWIIPMSQTDHWLADSALVVEADTIIDLLLTTEAKVKYPDAEHLNLGNQVLMPGFVNSHTHAAMNLLRGLSDDLPLSQWLEQAIWPTEQKFVDDNFVYQGTQHAIAEMLRSGTTCFQDMYFMPDQAAKAVQDSGIRASIGMVIIDFKTCWSQDAQDAIDKGLDVFDQHKHSKRITFNFAPHAPYTVSTANLEKIATLSHELNLPVQIHLHETQQEVADYQKQHGIRPVEQLRNIGLLSPLLNAVHMTQLNDTEIQWLAESNSHVIHCPQSNMKLASGICPTQALLDAGINVAIGTDGAASNNDLDMLDETRTASMLAKLHSQMPTAMTAYQALYCATMGGAKALGLQDSIGSLEIGKAADFITIDVNTIESQPLYNPISQVVYTASRNQVSHVWVNGKCLLKAGQLQSLNSNAILQNVKQWQQLIKQN